MSQYRQQDRALHALIDRLPIPLPWKTAAKKVLRDALALDHLSNGGLVSLIEEKQERSRVSQHCSSGLCNPLRELQLTSARFGSPQNLLRMLIAAEKGVEQQRR